MLSSTLAVATLLNLVGNANSLAIPNVSSTQYHYVPVDFDYGSDSRVTANFTFGTAPNPEPIKIVMDTGSANFWIWQPNSTINYGSPYLGFTGPCNESVAAEYDPSKSATAVLSNHSSAYAYAGNAKIVSGVQYANDTLTAIGGDGPIPNVEVALENYALFRQRDDGSCRGITFDKGILGLAPFTNTTTGPSFRQNLYDAGAVGSKTMFMWFNKAATDFTRMTGGTLFGAIDTSKFTGPLVRVPQVVGESQSGLYVPRPLITFNGKTYNTSDTENCLVDAGSHADALPFPYTGNESTIFYAQSGGQLMDWNGLVAFNGTCDTIPKNLTIGYTFPGVDSTQSVKIDVPIRNYARGALTQNATLDATICLLNLEMGGCLFAAPFSTAAFVALDDEDNSIAFAQGGVSEEGEGVNVGSLKVIGPGQSWDTV